MDFFVVIEQLQDTDGGYWLAFAIICTLGAYYLVFRRLLRSIFDPLSVVVLLSACASALLMLLVGVRAVSAGKAAFVAVTLGLLYLPLFIFGKDAAVSKSRNREPMQIPGSRQLLALLLLHVILQTIIYVGFGVPLFRQSRLTLFEEGGGVGVLGRLKDGIEFASVVLAFIYLQSAKRKRRTAWLILMSAGTSALLSGSKAAILILPFGWYLAHVYSGRSWRIAPRRLGPLMLTFAALVLIPLLIVAGQSRGELETVFDIARTLAIRVVAEGDAYAYFLAENRIDAVSTPDVLAVVRPILVALRLAPVESAITPGFEIIRDLFGDLNGGWGPNTRLPIFILYFYGPTGLMLAPLFGLLLVASRNWTLSLTGRSPLRFAMAASIYLACARVEVDPQITVNGIFNVALAALLIYLVYLAFPPRMARLVSSRRPYAST